MSGLDDLRDALGGIPVEVDGLDDGDAGRLAGLVVDARRRQAAELRAAVEGGLGHIPRLLRGPIKKLLF